MSSVRGEGQDSRNTLTDSASDQDFVAMYLSVGGSHREERTYIPRQLGLCVLIVEKNTYKFMLCIFLMDELLQREQ